MPRPKPETPYVQIALRLTPALHEKVMRLVNSSPFTVVGAIRHMIEFYEEMTPADVGRVMRAIPPPPESKPAPQTFKPRATSNDGVQYGPSKADPGSRLKKK